MSDPLKEPNRMRSQKKAFSMKFHCIDRHSGGINAVFVDMDVRHVGIKQMWRLKWHENFNFASAQPPNAWPTWLQTYKDY